VVEEATLRELAPSALLKDGADLEFRVQRLRIDPRAQALVALLRHGLHAGTAEPLEAESVALTLVGRGLGPRSARAARGSSARPPSSAARCSAERRQHPIAKDSDSAPQRSVAYSSLPECGGSIRRAVS